LKASRERSPLLESKRYLQAYFLIVVDVPIKVAASSPFRFVRPYISSLSLKRSSEQADLQYLLMKMLARHHKASAKLHEGADVKGLFLIFI